MVPYRAARATPAVARQLGLLLMVALVGWCVLRGQVHIRNQKPDFIYFYQGGAWLLQHGVLDPGYDIKRGQVERRGRLDWYWPAVSRYMTLFGWLPPRKAGHVWQALNVVALFALFRLLGRRFSGLPPEDWTVTQVAPLLCVYAYLQWEMQLNQIDILTLLLLVGSFLAWERGQQALGGFWLGLAVLLKLTPGLLMLWFLLKRQWRTASVAVLTVALAGPVSDVVALGPQLATEAYRDWFERAVTRGSQGGLIRNDLELDWRNQATGAVLTRWLSPVSYTTKLDNDPREAASYNDATVATFNIADVSPETLARLATGLTLASLLVLVWIGRRPADQLGPWRLRLEWALFVLAMLWMMPVMRRYHVIWALPALTLLGGAIHHIGLRSAWSRVVLACAAVMALAQVTLFIRALEARGTVLFSILLLSVPLIWLLLRPSLLTKLATANVQDTEADDLQPRRDLRAPSTDAAPTHVAG